MELHVNNLHGRHTASVGLHPVRNVFLSWRFVLESDQGLIKPTANMRKIAIHMSRFTQCERVYICTEGRRELRLWRRSGKIWKDGRDRGARSVNPLHGKPGKGKKFLLDGKDASEGRGVLTVRIPECKDYSLRSIDKQTVMTCPHAHVQKYAAILPMVQ